MYLVPNKDKSQEGGNDAFGVEESILKPDDILFQEPEVDGPKIRYGYRTGGMRFMVPEGMVSELLHNSKIYHLPNANRWLVGLTNMHGNVMPIVDIASYAGVNISHLNKSNVLAIGEGELSIGVLIDGLPEAIKENEIINDIKNQTKIDFELDEQGIIIKADTIGSLEALIKESRDKNIKIMKAEIGNVSKRDIVEANATLDELNKVIFAFNVKLLPEAKEELINSDLKVFNEDVIYTIMLIMAKSGLSWDDLETILRKRWQ